MDLNKKAQKGQGLIEYALIMVLVVLVGMIGLFFFGPAVKTTYGKVVCQMEGVTGDPGCYYFLPDSSTLRGGTATVTWTAAPGALRYDVKTQVYSCHYGLPSCTAAPRGDTYDAADICRDGTCSVSFASHSGRYVTITAYGKQSQRVVTGTIP